MHGLHLREQIAEFAVVDFYAVIDTANIGPSKFEFAVFHPSSWERFAFHFPVGVPSGGDRRGGLPQDPLRGEPDFDPDICVEARCGTS